MPSSGVIYSIPLNAEGSREQNIQSYDFFSLTQGCKGVSLNKARSKAIFTERERQK
jgi:hypothetical protein